PAASPNVLAVGGTTINRSAAGKFLGEVAWDCSGGSLRGDLARPSYQKNLTPALRGRATADVAATSNIRRGVFVYAGEISVTVDEEKKRIDRDGWIIMGGTSAATPIVAGIINRSQTLHKNSLAQLAVIYQKLGTGSFTDVAAGQCGPLVTEEGINCCSAASQRDKCCDPNSAETKSGRCDIKRSYKAGAGWDYCTGVGTPKGTSGF